MVIAEPNDGLTERPQSPDQPVTSANPSLQDPDVEVSVLGAMLVFPEEGIPGARSILSAAMFTRPAHRPIFQALCRLSDAGRSVDPITLRSELEAAEDLDAAGGVAYLGELLDTIPNARHVQDHARIVRDLYLRRKAIRDLQDRTVPLGDAAASIAAAADQGNGVADGPVFVSLDDLFQRPELLDPPEAIAPRFAHREYALMLASTDKGGKSTLAAHITKAVSTGGFFLGEKVGQGRVLWVGLEETLRDAVRRFRELDADPTRIMVAVASPRDLRSQIRALLTEWPADLVIIDSLIEYARTTEGEAPKDGDSSAWANVVRPLVALAREFRVAILTLHHTTKDGENYRSSNEIGAAHDARLTMTEPKKDEDPTVRHLTGKGRWTIEPFDVALRDGQYQMASGGEISLDALLLLHVEQEPGASVTELQRLVGKRRESVIQTLNRLEARGAIENRGTEQRPEYHASAGQTSLEDAA